MDVGVPRVEGPMAKKVYETMMNSSKNDKSKEEKRKIREQRLKEFSIRIKNK